MTVHVYIHICSFVDGGEACLYREYLLKKWLSFQFGSMLFLPVIKCKVKVLLESVSTPKNNDNDIHDLTI